MNIFKVEIDNYRQYLGHNVVDFSTDDSHNITIIRGNNGEGKSNFLNAITWCLYGDEMFKSKNNTSRPIINESIAQNIKEGDSEITRVTVYLGNGFPQLYFQRTASFTKSGTEIIEHPHEFCCMTIDDEKGWNEESFPELVVENKFIPKELRGFFFFDGEKMDEYFEDTSKIKPNVERIAQIDVLQRIIDALTKLDSKIKREMGKYANNEKLPDIETETEKLQQCSNKKTEYEETRDSNKKVIEDIDEYLLSNSSTIVSQLVKERKDKSDLKSKVVADIKNDQDSIKNLIYNALPIVFAYDALDSAIKLLEEKTSKGILPPNIRDVFLKDLLDTGICICGRSLDDPNCRHSIEILLQNSVSSEIVEKSIEGKYMISEMKEKANFVPSLKILRDEIRTKDSELDNLTSEITSISNKISAFNEEEIKKHEDQRNKLSEENEVLSEKIGQLAIEINQHSAAVSKYDEELDRIKTKNTKYNKLDIEHQKVSSILSIAQDIKNSIVEEIRAILEEKTKRYFFELIWKKDAFADVRIIDEGFRYRISVTSEHGNECLGDLSAGEKQVLALSFTAALYTVSGYSVPVFIDTPLGRISEQPRENIAANLPNYLSQTQLIMLPTDTEYTEVVREKISKRIGYEYKIIHDEDTKSSKVIPYE